MPKKEAPVEASRVSRVLLAGDSFEAARFLRHTHIYIYVYEFIYEFIYLFIYLFIYIYLYVYVYIYLLYIYILLYIERCRVRKICCSIAAQVLQTIQGVTAYMLNIDSSPTLFPLCFQRLSLRLQFYLLTEGLPMPVFPLGFRWFFSDFLTLFFVCVCVLFFCCHCCA